MSAEGRPAFYALSPGGWRDYVTVLHPPYTLWHLSYVAIGACLAPQLSTGRLALTAVAFALAMGVGAHALDELHGRPLATRIPGRTLVVLAAVSIGAAAGIGLWASFAWTLWLLPFVAVGAFIVLAYNLEWFGGRFHSDLWFALAWGAFPLLTAYVAEAERLRAAALVAAVFATLSSLAQRRLSTQVRMVRRRLVAVSGTIELHDGTREPVTAATLAEAPERGAPAARRRDRRAGRGSARASPDLEAGCAYDARVSAVTVFELLFAVSVLVAGAALAAALTGAVGRRVIGAAAAGVGAIAIAAWVTFALEPDRSLAVAATGLTMCVLAILAAGAVTVVLARSRDAERRIAEAERRLDEHVEELLQDRESELERTLARARSDSLSLLTEHERQLGEERRRTATEREKEATAKLSDALAEVQRRIDVRFTAWTEDLERIQQGLEARLASVTQRHEQAIAAVGARMKQELDRLTTDTDEQRAALVRVRAEFEQAAETSVAAATAELEAHAGERRRALRELADRLQRREHELSARIENEETEAVRRIQASFADIERRQVEQLGRVVERASERFLELANQQFEAGARTRPRGRGPAPRARAGPRSPDLCPRCPVLARGGARPGRRHGYSAPRPARGRGHLGARAAARHLRGRARAAAGPDRARVPGPAALDQRGGRGRARNPGGTAPGAGPPDGRDGDRQQALNEGRRQLRREGFV